jgi:hypothetical protein
MFDGVAVKEEMTGAAGFTVTVTDAELEPPGFVAVRV